MIARFMQASSFVSPHAAHHRREQRFPPCVCMPSAKVSMKIFRARRLPHEHRKSRVAAELVEKSIDETRLLFRSELATPQLIEIARFENAARGEISARQRVANAESEKVILKSRCFADEARSVRRRLPLEMKVHVRVAGARLARQLERMNLSRLGERVIEVVIDLLEVSDDRAAERGDAVHDEQI